MIKFSGKTEDGKPVFGFGLSLGNFTKLLKGLPICVDLADMGYEPGGNVIIIGGETEEDLAKQIVNSGLMAPDASIHEQKQTHEG